MIALTQRQMSIVSMIAYLQGGGAVISNLMTICILLRQYKNIIRGFYLFIYYRFILNETIQDLSFSDLSI